MGIGSGTQLGIDLGTTSTLAAVSQGSAAPQLLADISGRTAIPSAVCVSAEGVSVGFEARENSRFDPEGFVEYFKHHMGDPRFSAWLGGVSRTAEDLSALLLKGFIDGLRAANDLPESPRAVVTVPAYFQSPQREATVRAAQSAGLVVDALLNEPTAAAMSCLMRLPERGERIVVFDLGGGTLDVTVGTGGARELDVRAIAGLQGHGGLNWDSEIQRWLCELYEEKTGEAPDDDPELLGEMLAAAESVKMRLGELDRATVSLTCGDEYQRFELSAAEFERRTEHLVQRSIEITRLALADAQLGWAEISHLILVGGSTRLRAIRRAISKESGLTPLGGVQPDEAVVRGAAIFSGSLGISAGKGNGITAVSLTEAIAHDLGKIVWSDEAYDYRNEVIVPRNSKIPIEEKLSFAANTRDGSDNYAEVWVLQGGDPDPRKCLCLGCYRVPLEHEVSGTVEIEIGYRYDSNGVVEVFASHIETGERLCVVRQPPPVDLSWLDDADTSAMEPLPDRLVILAVDLSGSMSGRGVQEAEAAATDDHFLDDLGAGHGIRIGLVGFGDRGGELLSPTLERKVLVEGIMSWRGSVGRFGVGNLGEPFTTVSELIIRSGIEARQTELVVLTDGHWNRAEEAIKLADELKRRGVTIHAQGCGSASEEFLRRISSPKGHSELAAHGELAASFRHIARRIRDGRNHLDAGSASGQQQ